MKAKLIKVNDNYVLVEPLTTPEEGMLFITKDNVLHTNIGWNYGDRLVTASTNTQYNINKLSLKNCQAIELGYDLDELAENYANYMNDDDGTSDIDFKAGFLKALELMGDKKFSEEDMSKAWSEGYHRRVDEINGNELRYFDKFIQSLQQTEWDVEIEMVKEEYIWSPPGEGFEDQTYRDWREVPKLDDEGCLILKRI